jgi:hypothetical protein
MIEWEAGPAAVQRLRRGMSPRLALAVDRAAGELSSELRRRLGPSYSKDDLYALYGDADRWARPLIARALAPLRDPTVVAPLIDAAFWGATTGTRDR